jgi:hypothetical protein
VVDALALQWILAAVAVIGVLGQWGVGAYWAGRMAQRTETNSEEIADLKLKVSDHETRISHLEGHQKRVQA